MSDTVKMEDWLQAVIAEELIPLLDAGKIETPRYNVNQTYEEKEALALVAVGLAVIRLQIR